MKKRTRRARDIAGYRYGWEKKRSVGAESRRRSATSAFFGSSPSDASEAIASAAAAAVSSPRVSSPVPSPTPSPAIAEGPSRAVTARCLRASRGEARQRGGFLLHPRRRRRLRVAGGRCRRPRVGVFGPLAIARVVAASAPVALAIVAAAAVVVRIDPRAIHAVLATPARLLALPLARARLLALERRERFPPSVGGQGRRRVAVIPQALGARLEHVPRALAEPTPLRQESPRFRGGRLTRALLHGARCTGLGKRRRSRENAAWRRRQSIRRPRDLNKLRQFPPKGGCRRAENTAPRGDLPRASARSHTSARALARRERFAFRSVALVVSSHRRAGAGDAGGREVARGG